MLHSMLMDSNILLVHYDTAQYRSDKKKLFKKKSKED